MSELRKLLKNVSIFSALDDQTLDGLASHLRKRTFKKDTMIFHQGQAGDALYIVESGYVKIFLPTERGEELILPDFVGPEDVFGELALLDGGLRSASAEAIEDTTIWILSRDDFLKSLSATPQLATSLIALLSKRIRNITEYAESLAFLDIQGRVARSLDLLGKRHGTKIDSQIELDLELTQTELASMVGATRERVNRALKSFEKQGIIDQRGKKIVILDVARLQQRIY